MPDTELTRRLEKLERDNRRLKRGGLALLAMLVALTTIYATRPVPDVIKAHKFEVLDSAGKVRISMYLGTMHWPEIGLSDAKGNEDAQLYVADDGGVLFLQNRPPKRGTSSASPQTSMPPARFGDKRPRGKYPSVMWLDNSGLTFHDSQGQEMDLGSGFTGIKTQPTSVNSIIMFGNDKQHHVIWKAP